MSITRAQQARQMYKRGTFGGSRGPQGPAGGASAGGNYGGNRNPSQDYGGGGGDRDDRREQYSVASTTGTSPKSITAPVDKTGPGTAQQRVIDMLGDFKKERPEVNVPGLFGRFLKKPIQKFANFTAGKNRPFFEEVIRAGKIPGLNFATVAKMTPEELEQQYDNYMSARLSGEIDAFGNPLNQGDDSSPLLRTGIMAQAPKEDEEEDPFFPNFRLMADGGRVGLQEGGGIEQRLEQLGGDVTSAEQMLQGINQRLKTAESSLGSGGANSVTINAGMQQPTVLGGGLGSLQQPLGQPPAGDRDSFFPKGNVSFGNIPEQFRSGFINYLKENPNSFGFGGQAITPVGLPGGGAVTFGDTGSAGAFRKYLESTGFTPPSPLAVATLSPLGVDNMGFNFRQPGDMGRYVADNDPGQQFAGYSSYQDYLNAGNDPVERRQGPQPLLAAGVERIQTGQPIQMSAQQALENQGRIPSLSLEELYPNVGQKKIDPFPMRGGPEMFRNAGIPAAGYADGGLADIARQELVFGGVADAIGKGLKKATRAIKKIAKSPIGKAALLYGGFKGFQALGGGKGIMAKLFGQAAAGTKAMPGVGPLFKPATEGLFGKLGLTKGGGSLMPTVFGGILLPSLIAGATTKKDDETKTTDFGPDIDDPELIMRYPELYYNMRQFAEGGSTDKEPVAKKTMPLLDMGGMEKDYRAEGGFVPIGRMEKADDVPARLSKNEFVFTADAVRNAGDGDVDKGAEVMYNMMKNLEAGGEVSEESQGMDGARKMFQTSQRLGEVL